MSETAKVLDVVRPLVPNHDGALAQASVGTLVEQLPVAPRKLVRPQTNGHQVPRSVPRRLRGTGLSLHEEAFAPPVRSNQPRAAASHAEAFYLQKQMQAQIPMVFVLEDGEQIEGVIEWYDRDTIKVRHTTRTLVFKRTIKYLYKAGTEHEG